MFRLTKVTHYSFLGHQYSEMHSEKRLCICEIFIVFLQCMVNKELIHYILLLFVIFSLLTSCKPEGKSKVIEFSTVNEGELLQDFFSPEEIEGIKKIVSAFQTEMCKDLSSSDLVSCYEIDFATFRNDILQSHPIYINFPYTGTVKIDDFSEIAVTQTIWNDLCQIEYQNTKERVSYYCFYPSGPFIDYIKKWTSVNKTFANLISIIENEQFSFLQNNSLVYLENSNLDFNNPDLRIIYALIQLSLAEAYLVLKR